MIDPIPGHIRCGVVHDLVSSAIRAHENLPDLRVFAITVDDGSLGVLLDAEIAEKMSVQLARIAAELRGEATEQRREVWH